MIMTRALSLAILPLIPALTSPCRAQCDQGYLRGPAVTYAFFGGWVDVSGDLAAASGRSASGERTAYLFERQADTWAPLQQVTSGPLVSSYGTPLSLDGGTLMLSNIDTSNEAGSVEVFERIGGSFGHVVTLQPASSIPDSHFGRRIDIDGDRAVIAAPMDATYQYRGGAVFVFERIGGTWVETARLDPPTPRAFGFFGLSVAIEGDLLAVGEPGYAAFSGDTNYVYLYRNSNGTWTLEATLAPAQGIGFGYSLEIDDARVAVGAFRDGAGGSIYEFARVNGAWQLMATIRGIDVGASPLFGAKIDFDGGRLVAGSASAELGGNGPVVILMRGPAGWTTEAVIPPVAPPPSASLHAYGAGLALSDNDVIIGAPAIVSFGNATPTLAHVKTFGAPVASYCGTAATNSTGAAGRLRTIGCGAFSSNDLVLEAFDLPPFQVALMLVARQPGQSPLGGGSQGTLCLAGAVGRYVGQAGTTGASGTRQLSVDITNIPPTGTGAVAGETLYFQTWYRDANPQPTSNTTQGLAVLFR
jgi:hypothetical protein